MAKKSKLSGIKVKFVRARMDVNFVKRNWKALNETPLKRAGLLIRTVMMGSIRRRGAYSEKTGKRLKPSKPGKPPYARTGRHAKRPPFKYIISDPEYAPGKGVIGHVILPGKKQDPTVTPMQAHEFGEAVQRRTLKKQTGRRAKSAKQRKAARKKYQEGKIKRKKQPQFVTRQIRMPKRPFAFPALNKVKGKLSKYWKGIVNKDTIRK